MRILHLAKYYWPHSGGMERVVQDLAEGAAALGHDVTVVAYDKGSSRISRREKTRVTRVFSLGAVGAQELAPGYLAAARRRADVVHLHHPHGFADFAVLTRSRRTPLVITQHADTRRPSSKFLARMALKRAAGVVVPSRAHVALSTELVGLEGKVEVIPFGVDTERWSTVPPPVPGGPPRAIFIGRLLRYKGVDILLQIGRAHV